MAQPSPLVRSQFCNCVCNTSGVDKDQEMDCIKTVSIHPSLFKNWRQLTLNPITERDGEGTVLVMKREGQTTGKRANIQ